MCKKNAIKLWLKLLTVTRAQQKRGPRTRTSDAVQTLGFLVKESANTEYKVTGRQCSRKRVRQLKKNVKSHVFLDFEKKRKKT